jgi:hypothetical protein
MNETQLNVTLPTQNLEIRANIINADDLNVDPVNLRRQHVVIQIIDGPQTSLWSRMNARLATIFFNCINAFVPCCRCECCLIPNPTERV